MAIAFDGDNLVITLESGVTEVDVFEDIYESAKDWYRASSNRRYPFPFVSDGGNPLTSIINQGGYIFLRNDLGWRIKPPEEDTTIYLTGNLAVADTDLPAFAPTDGAYTAAILGLQPVTQGVTPAMATQLAFNTFQGVVCVDTRPGYGYDGVGAVGFDEIGTRRAPSSNMVDALMIAEREGLRTFQLLSNTTISDVDLSAGYLISGDSPFIVLTLDASADATNCRLFNLVVFGELDGLNTVERCSCWTITNASGFFEKCDFNASMSLSGPTKLYECYSGVEGGGYPTFLTGANIFVTRDFRGSYGITGMTGGEHSNGFGGGGRILLDNTCTGGTCHIRGFPFEIVDNSNGTTVLDESGSVKTNELWTRFGMNSAAPAEVKSGSHISATGIQVTLTTNPDGSVTLQRV